MGTFFVCIHDYYLDTLFHNLDSFNMKAFLICTYLIASSFCSVQKLFDEKFVTKKSFDLAKIKILHDSTQQMNKVTCSSLCLRDSRENCNAFRVNSKNECEVIENPEELQEDGYTNELFSGGTTNYFESGTTNSCCFFKSGTTNS